jgi:hypothetical protein
MSSSTTLKKRREIKTKGIIRNFKISRMRRKTIIIIGRRGSFKERFCLI